MDLTLNPFYTFTGLRQLNCRNVEIRIITKRGRPLSTLTQNWTSKLLSKDAFILSATISSIWNIVPTQLYCRLGGGSQFPKSFSGKSGKLRGFERFFLTMMHYDELAVITKFIALFNIYFFKFQRNCPLSKTDVPLLMWKNTGKVNIQDFLQVFQGSGIGKIKKQTAITAH